MQSPLAYSPGGYERRNAAALRPTAADRLNNYMNLPGKSHMSLTYVIAIDF